MSKSDLINFGSRKWFKWTQWNIKSCSLILRRKTESQPLRSSIRKVTHQWVNKTRYWERWGTLFKGDWEGKWRDTFSKRDWVERKRGAAKEDWHASQGEWEAHKPRRDQHLILVHTTLKEVVHYGFSRVVQLFYAQKSRQVLHRFWGSFWVHLLL